MFKATQWAELHTREPPIVPDAGLEGFLEARGAGAGGEGGAQPLHWTWAASTGDSPSFNGFLNGKQVESFRDFSRNFGKRQQGNAANAGNASPRAQRSPQPSPRVSPRASTQQQQQQHGSSSGTPPPLQQQQQQQQQQGGGDGGDEEERLARKGSFGEWLHGNAGAGSAAGAGRPSLRLSSLGPGARLSPQAAGGRKRVSIVDGGGGGGGGGGASSGGGSSVSRASKSHLLRRADSAPLVFAKKDGQAAEQQEEQQPGGNAHAAAAASATTAVPGQQQLGGRKSSRRQLHGDGSVGLAVLAVGEASAAEATAAAAAASAAGAAAGAGVTFFYHVSLSPGGHGWSVLRRWRDFELLQCELQKADVPLPPFPRKPPAPPAASPGGDAAAVAAAAAATTTAALDVWLRALPPLLEATRDVELAGQLGVALHDFGSKDHPRDRGNSAAAAADAAASAEGQAGGGGRPALRVETARLSVREQAAETTTMPGSSSGSGGGSSGQHSAKLAIKRLEADPSNVFRNFQYVNANAAAQLRVSGRGSGGGGAQSEPSSPF